MGILRTGKGRVAAFATAGTLALGAVGAPAATADPVVVVGGGLVDVQVVNVLNNAEILSRNNVGIGVAAGVAAQVCGVAVQVGVLAPQLAGGDDFVCRNSAGTQEVRITQ